MPSTQTRPDPLLEWRVEFPTVESTLHFISHSLGAMPRGVEEALRRYAHTWKARGIRAWEESWFALPDSQWMIRGLPSCTAFSRAA